MAFVAPLTTVFGATTGLRSAHSLQSRARPRRSRPGAARIYGLGATPPPPPPEEKPDGASGEAPATSASSQGDEPVAESGNGVAPEETTADDILSSPSFLKKKLQIVQNELREAREAVVKAEDAVESEKTGYVRLAADFENYRRRSAEDMRRQETRSVAKVCKAVLEVLDNFDRAIAAVQPETDRETSIQKSYMAINKQLVDALGRLQVESVDPLGVTFDPEVHEAIQQMESTEYVEGTVCAVFSKGYVIGDSLIRAAIVGVSNGPGPEVSAEDVPAEEGEAAPDGKDVEEQAK